MKTGMPQVCRVPLTQVDATTARPSRQITRVPPDHPLRRLGVPARTAASLTFASQGQAGRCGKLGNIRDVDDYHAATV
jgi:hypothetical protein